MGLALTNSTSMRSPVAGGGAAVARGRRARTSASTAWKGASASRRLRKPGPGDLDGAHVGRGRRGGLEERGDLARGLARDLLGGERHVGGEVAVLGALGAVDGVARREHVGRQRALAHQAGERALDQRSDVLLDAHCRRMVSPVGRGRATFRGGEGHTGQRTARDASRAARPGTPLARRPRGGMAVTKLLGIGAVLALAACAVPGRPLLLRSTPGS